MRNGRVLVAMGVVMMAPAILVLACGEETASTTPPVTTPTGTTTGTGTGTTPTSTTPTPTPTPTTTSPPPDAGVDAAKYCSLGVARGDTTGGTVKLFDKQGNPLPSGHYRISYVDGCMQYGGGQSFTVHAYEPGADAAAYATWILTNDETNGVTGLQPVQLPGIWIFGGDAAAPAGGAYEACVALSKTWAPVEFEYDAGAKLGVVVNDNPLGDNVAGPDGGDPTWRLEVWSPTGACP